MLELSSVTNLPTLSSILSARAADQPDRLVFADASASLTYGELDREATRMAGALFSSGVRRGDRVALFVSSGVAFCRVFWGIQRLGAIPCAFNPYAPAATSARRAARLRPRLIIHDHAAPADLPGHVLDQVRSISIEDLDLASGEPELEPGSSADVAYLQPTSGTSGEPRIAILLQRNVIAIYRSMHEALPIVEKDVYVAWVPPWHDLGLVRFVMGAPVAGVACHFVPPAIHTIPLWLQTIDRVRGTITGAPDFAWRLATQLGDPSLDLTSLRYAGNGGEPCRASTIAAFEAKFRVSGVIRPGYGLAEATLGVAIHRVGDEFHIDDRGNVACGLPAPGFEIRIDAEPDEDAGEILVRGPAVFAGYFDAPEATAETLRDGWLHTGDIGHFDEGGRLYVLGRKRAMLKRGGAVLAPRELEEAAQSVPGVKIAAAVGLPPSEERSTEEIVVVIELGGDAADAHGIVTAVSRAVQLDAGFAPDRVMVVAPRSIPRTWNGKIRHDALRKEIVEGTLVASATAVVNGAAATSV